MLRKGLVLGIIVIFVGAGVIPSMGETIVERHGSQDNKTSFMGFTPRGNILYVGGDGEGNYTSIQEAINDASNGDTVFVFDNSSPYYENVIINKTINLIGEDRATTVIDGSNGGDVVYVSANWVNISGFTIRNSSGAGIDIRSSYNTILGNTVTSNRMYSIYLEDSNTNTITRNTISNNWGNGIDSYFSNKNIITSNTILSNWYGIFLKFSSANNITGNNLSSNMIGIYLTYGSIINIIYYNNFINNSLNAFDIVRSNIILLNLYCSNYWDNWIGLRLEILRFLPYHIRGGLFSLKFDWHPALRPYYI